MHIRKACQDDVVSINEIYNQAIAIRTTGYLDQLSLEQTKNWLSAHVANRFPVFVAEQDNEVIGWLSFSAYRPGRLAFARTAEVSYFVHELHRRKGIGRALLKHAMQAAPSLGYKTMIAILLENNIPSIRLLEEFGFEKWGLLPDVAEFDDNTCSHLYMGKKLC